jgi:hypothetical protein
LWSNYIKNDFFDQICGKDNIDYRKNSRATQISTAGVGIGNIVQY